jgi:hypothetical protein
MLSYIIWLRVIITPSVDSNWHNIPRHQQEKRWNTIGVVAELAVAKKTANKGSLLPRTTATWERLLNGKPLSPPRLTHIHWNRWLRFCIFPRIHQNRLWRSGNEYNAEQNTKFLSCATGAHVWVANSIRILPPYQCKELQASDDKLFDAQHMMSNFCIYCPHILLPPHVSIQGWAVRVSSATAFHAVTVTLLANHAWLQ